MSVFDFATVAVSFILGLAVAFLLESMVQAFRARGRCRLDWIPFVWVACVFVHQFQFWWAIYALQSMPTMSVVVFSQLLFLAALLFIAGALVLPSGEADYPTDLAGYFTYDGSWGVAALALYNAAVVGSNVLLFDVDVLVPGNLLNMVLAVNTTLVVFARTRRWLIVLTLVYVVVLTVATIVNTPGSY